MEKHCDNRQFRHWRRLHAAPTALHPDATVHAYSRTPAAQAAPPVVHHLIDYADEASIAAAASRFSRSSH